MNISITKKSARIFLQKAGFNINDVLRSLQRKELIQVNEKIQADWDGVEKFINKVQQKLMNISHELMEVKLKIKEGFHYSKSNKSDRQPLTPEKILLAFDSNKTTIPESKLLEEENITAGIETLERLAELRTLKIKEKKRSRQISLTSDGSALRYLFLKKSNLNPANYEYLEETFLSPYTINWDDFLALLNSGKDSLPPWIPMVLIIFINLGVIIRNQETFSLSPPSALAPFEKERARMLQEDITGFIPVYVIRMFEVLLKLNDFDNSKDIQQALSLGSSSINGILKMLTRFTLVIRNETTKKYQLTSIGTKLSALDLEKFKETFREHIQVFPIFTEVLNFVKETSDLKFGFMDLSGYFRASGVSNFNLAKALSIIRLMTQLSMNLKEVKSGYYQLVE